MGNKMNLAKVLLVQHSLQSVIGCRLVSVRSNWGYEHLFTFQRYPAKPLKIFLSFIVWDALLKPCKKIVYSWIYVYTALVHYKTGLRKEYGLKRDCHTCCSMLFVTYILSCTSQKINSRTVDLFTDLRFSVMFCVIENAVCNEIGPQYYFSYCRQYVCC